MTIVITRLFDTYERASEAIAELQSSGVSRDDISLAANNAEGRYTLPADSNPVGPGAVGPGAVAPAAVAPGEAQVAGSSAGTGATIGTVLGGGAGLFAGLGMLAIPGVGPVVAAGWLVATAVGAGVGAGAGGLLGGLVGAGVDESDAHVYAEGVRRGDILVTVRAPESQRGTVEQVMARFDAVDATTRGAAYRADGWDRLAESAPAYPAGTLPLLGAVPTPLATPEAEPDLRPKTLV